MQRAPTSSADTDSQSEDKWLGSSKPQLGGRACTPTACAMRGTTSRPTATNVDAHANKPTKSWRPPQGTCKL